MSNTHVNIAVPEDAVDEIDGGRDGCVSEDRAAPLKNSFILQAFYLSMEVWCLHNAL